MAKKQPKPPASSKRRVAPAGMARLIAEKNWKKTPLGPREAWPRALEAVVQMLIPQALPMVVLWGPELVQIYNDGYAVIAGKKHPKALGQPTYECWPEVQDFTRPLYGRVLAGESVTFEDQPLVLERNRQPENVFLTLSYSPLRDDTGQIAGLLCVVFDTTAKILAERDRAQARADQHRVDDQRQLALEAAQMGWWHLDPHNGRVRWDERLRKIFGSREESVTFEDVLAQILPEDRTHVRKKVAEAVAPRSDGRYFVEYRIRRPDHSIRWVESRGEAVFEGTGKDRRAVGFYGTGADVTETKEAEAAVRATSERLSIALAAAELGDWEWDFASDRMTLSPRAAEIYGVKPGATRTRAALRKLLVDGDREAAKNELDRSLKTRTDYNIEYRVRRPDGLVVWVAAKGRSVEDAEGKIVRMLGVVQDISARKAAELEREQLLDKVASEQARLSAAFQRSPAFMCVLTGPEHTFEFANDMYYQLIGHREIIGKPIGVALPEIAGQGYFELLDKVYHEAEPSDGREALVRIQRRPDAPIEDRYVDFVYQPITDAAGAVSGVFVHGVDITEHRATRHEREQLLESERTARSNAERANRLKDEFLATVSHELRTPLSAILGWAQVLNEAGELPAEVKEGLAVIERNARAQTQIVEDLLDMSRIISGKLRLDVQKIDLAEIVKTGVETARPGADAKGVRLGTVIDPLAGPVKGDPSRVQQIVWNLLSNAIKFTPKGGRVQIALERVNSHIEISVTDSGMGIDPQFLPHVFDRFSQSDSSIRRKHGGLGLGLAIVKQLVELHGGSVRVKSLGLNLGSTFTVALPLMPVHPEAAAEKERRHPSSGTSSDPFDPVVDLPGVRALVVDDEPDARALVKRLLEQHHAVVTPVGSAAEAIAQLQQNEFDVLISDIGMPEEDGYRLIEKVRALPPAHNRDIPALALTAYARSEDRMRAIRAGYQMHIAKPVETAELLTMVASLTNRQPPPKLKAK